MKKLSVKSHDESCHWSLRVFKRIVFFTAIACISLQFTNCTKSEMEDDLYNESQKPYKYRGVYPKAKISTRSLADGFWESWDQIQLRSGEKVNVPWNPKSTHSSVPHDILEDIKFEDGWDLIYYLIGENGDYQGNDPYLVFHNRYTGILKVFYYFSPNSFEPNNYGVWQISTKAPSSLFAFQNNPITLVSEKQNKTYNVSNITYNSSHGFTVGWNCFQIELAYDPDQSGWLHVDTQASNKIQISFTGNIEADTSGLMTTSEGGQANNLKKGVAKIAGNEAGNWINKKLKDKTILGISSSTIASGVKAIVSGGVGSVLGAITGLFKSDNTTKSLQLTTNGTFSCNGEATFLSTTGIEPIEFCIDPEMVGYLGVWALREEPTLKCSPYAVLKSPQQYSNGYSSEYQVNIININTERAKVIFNPESTQSASSHNHSTQYYQSLNFTRLNVWGSVGTLGRDPILSNQVYVNLYKPKSYIWADVPFKGEEDAYIPVGQYEAPMEVFIPNVPNGPKGAIPDFRYNSRFLASVGVHITLPNGSEAYSYHQCVPKMDWNLSEYNNGLYMYLYPCQPVEQFNSSANSYYSDKIREVLSKSLLSK